SLGAAGLFEQASVLALYDPQRAQRVRHRDAPSSWDALLERLRAPRDDRGAGLRVLCEPTSSPLLLASVERVRERFPRARFSFDAPWRAGNALEGARLAFGRALAP